ncbi:MAG: AAA family ATPase [Burkholderiaceae bacterium]|nr:AAA family ATPase [Burkholderiaceae bacterium]
MYTSFFGLKEEPFSIAPDPRFLFMSERHREALAHLLYGLGGSGGFVLLSGEIGAGKTTVSRCFLEQVPQNCNVAYIFNPKLTVNELLKSVCDEFHIPYTHQQPGMATVKDYIDPLNEYLLRTHAAGENNALIIDEAQNLSADVLEQLRLLTNLETNERKLLQIILIGQPELRVMLSQPGLEQLAQRVIARFHLDALSEVEAASYVAHRLAVAGMTGAMPFDRKALRRIYRLSRGVPRRINLLCDRALLGAYASGKSSVTCSIVDKAANEVFDHARSAAPRRTRNRRAAAVGLAAVATLAGAAFFGINTRALRDAQTTSKPSAKVATGAASAPAVAASASPHQTTQRASAAHMSAASEPKINAKPALRTADEAWRELAPLWNLALGDADPCQAAELRGVHCFRKASTLPLIRQLDRPGILTLNEDGNKAVYALLTGLTSRTATLRIAGTSTTLPLDVLTQMWRGDFATFWRVPPGYRDNVAIADSSQVADWIRAQLAALQGNTQHSINESMSAPLKSKIRAFQRAYALTPDGVAGPITLMQLNRATGVDEPSLDTGI